MIFSKKNAGKWIASKGDTIIATAGSLQGLAKKVERRKDKKEVKFDLVPPAQFFAGRCHHGV
jgi:hypothetical protein